MRPLLPVAGLKPVKVDRWGSIELGDVIVGINKKTVTTYNDLYAALDGRQPGEEITVVFVRSKRRLKVNLLLQELH